MDTNYDNLKNFIERIKSITFIDRLFRWRFVREQLLGAVTDLQKITSNIGYLKSSNDELTRVNSDLKKDLELVRTQAISQAFELQAGKESIKALEARISGLTADAASKKATIENNKERINKLLLDYETLQTNYKNLITERNGLKDENTRLKSSEETRRLKYENDVATLNSIREGIEKDRNEEVQAMLEADVLRLKNQKETWSKHQTLVKSTIRTICQKHIIEYVEKVPFKGEPDNTLKICGEYVVFDAKSPASDDLTNFPNYIKEQAERAKKYARQDGVKKDIFFVIPSNTLERLSQFVFNLGDFDVYVISIDCLEQVILNIKKIEAYEFAESLSPEERDNICRVLGKFVHLTKRRIQIDSFFTKRFLELAYQSEADLPRDFLDKVNEFERAEKINPPQEKRTKSIPIKELEKDTSKLTSDVATRGIMVNPEVLSKGIDGLELYKPNTR